MSDESNPIPPERFAQAIEDLPVENLYTKAQEINNSIIHLETSNSLLQEYSDSIAKDQSLPAEERSVGDKDCLDAIRENGIVIERQRERVRLLKSEVERRGQRWHEADPGEKPDVSNGQIAAVANAAHSTQASVGLSDEELRRRLEERLEQDDEEEEGMYL